MLYPCVAHEISSIRTFTRDYQGKRVDPPHRPYRQGYARRMDSPKRLSRNYLRQNGGKYSKAFHTTDVFRTPSRLFVQWTFVCLCPFGGSFFYRSFSFTELKLIKID